MRERLKPVVRAAFLLLFVLIAYLWQRKTGGGAGALLGSTLAVALGLVLVVGALFGILGWIMRAGSGRREQGESRRGSHELSGPSRRPAPPAGPRSRRGRAGDRP